jgi:predicted RNA methylase
MDNAVRAHYDSFLAPLYSWMSGGFHAQAAKNRQFFSAHALRPQNGGVAVDLGAGCGFQSIPLAILGFSVSAVDSCQSLLDELRRNTAGLPVRPVAGDLQDYLV